MFKAIADTLLSIAFPLQCHLCENFVESYDDGVACADCWDTTRSIAATDLTCAKCGRLGEMPGNADLSDCPYCRDHQYESAVAGGVYENALKAVVLELKTTPHVPRRARDLLMSAFERSRHSRAELLVPVPLSSRRKIERGFNQAELLAKVLSKRTGIPIDSHSLIRDRDTHVHRAGMDRRARETSVKNAFKVVRPRLLEGKSILLIDDVFTTGATASHCAAVLKKSGSANVSVLTLARAC